MVIKVKSQIPSLVQISMNIIPIPLSVHLPYGYSSMIKVIDPLSSFALKLKSLYSGKGVMVFQCRTFDTFDNQPSKCNVKSCSCALLNILSLPL